MKGEDAIFQAVLPLCGPVRRVRLAALSESRAVQGHCSRAATKLSAFLYEMTGFALGTGVASLHARVAPFYLPLP